MKQLLILSFLLLPALSSFACSCATPALTPAGLKSKGYVALVKIKEQQPFDEAKFNHDLNLPIQYEVLIEEIMLFKGPSQQVIVVYGAPPTSTSVRTSCDIDVSKGQEWLIIADLSSEGSVTIDMCSHSMLYRDKEGFRNWQYSSATNWLKLISDSLSNTSLSFDLGTDKPFIFYPNGQVERTISYKNGKKDGATIYYYPDGTIYGRIEYKKDSLNGKKIWYDRKGQIQSKATYHMGKPVDTVISYMYPNAPMFVSVYSKKGIIQKSQSYHGDLATRTSSYLSSETLFKSGQQVSTVYYRENGTVRLIAKYHDQGTTEVSYDEAGNVIQRKEFDKKSNIY